MLGRVLDLVAVVVARLPLAAVRALGVCLGTVAWWARIRRAHVVASMRRAGVEDVERAARRMYIGLGVGVFELLWMRGGGSPVRALAELDEASRTALAAARARGRGVVLAASHTGNWEIAACRIAEDSDLVAVAKPLSVAGFHAFAHEMRARRRIDTVYAARWPSRPAGVVDRALAALRCGGAVAMMLDQVPLRRRHALEVDFLGAPAFVDRAPAVVALLAGAPLVVAASRRVADGAHALHVLAVHEPPPRASRAGRAGREWVDRVTVEATRALERFVRENPSDWLWLHRRWATPLA